MTRLITWAASSLLLAVFLTGCKPAPTSATPEASNASTAPASKGPQASTLATEERHRAPELRETTVGGLAFSLDGTLLATAGPAWLTGDEATAESLPGSLPGGHEATVRDGASSLTGQVMLWDWAMEKPKRMLEDPRSSPYRYLRFSPDSRLLTAVNASKKKLFLWDVKTGKLLRSYPTSGAEPAFLEFTPDSRFLVFLDRPANKVYKVRTADDGIEQLPGLDFEDASLVGEIVYCPVNDLLVASHAETRSGKDQFALLAYHLFRPGPPRKISLAGHPNVKSFSADGKLLAFSYLMVDSEAGAREKNVTLEVWDTTTWKRKTALHPGENPSFVLYQAIRLSGDGKYLVGAAVLTNPSQAALVVWDVQAKKLSRLNATASGTSEMYLSPDGKTLALTYAVEPVKFFDLATGTEKER